MPPKTEPRVHHNAALNDFLGAPTPMAISRTSGGIGKKDDSAKDSRNNDICAFLVSAKLSVQFFKLSIHCWIFLIIFTFVPFKKLAKINDFGFCKLIVF